VQINIETVALHLGGDAQADEEIDELEDDQRDDGIIDDDDDDAFDLVDQLPRIPLDQALGSAVLLNGKHAGQDRTGGAADRVHSEAVERIVVSKRRLDPSDGDVTHDADRN